MLTMTMIDVTTLTDDALEGMLGIPGLAFTAHNELVRRNTPAPTSWCDTCGQPVMNNVCVCWVHLADDLQRYLGYEHDGAAEQAKIMWDNLGPIDRERVWSAEYAETHDVETYPQEHDYKPITPQEATDVLREKPTKRVMWFVTYGDAYEPGMTAGVFTTKEKADAVAADKYVSRYDWKSVEEITVDEFHDASYRG